MVTHRYYAAGKGRFLTRDPIGYAGGINLYGFVGNNPVTGADPEGTDAYAYFIYGNTKNKGLEHAAYDLSGTHAEVVFDTPRGPILASYANAETVAYRTIGKSTRLDPMHASSFTASDEITHGWHIHLTHKQDAAMLSYLLSQIRDKGKKVTVDQMFALVKKKGGDYVFDTIHRYTATGDNCTTEAADLLRAGGVIFPDDWPRYLPSNLDGELGRAAKLGAYFGRMEPGRSVWPKIDEIRGR